MASFILDTWLILFLHIRIMKPCKFIWIGAICRKKCVTHLNSHIRCVRPLYVYISCINVPNFIASSTPSGRGFVVCTASCFLTRGGKNVNWQLHGATRPPSSRPQRDDDGSGGGDAIPCVLWPCEIRTSRLPYVRAHPFGDNSPDKFGPREREREKKVFIPRIFHSYEVKFYQLNNCFRRVMWKKQCGLTTSVDERR